MIYARKGPEKYNTAGMVYVAEVDSLGRRTAGPEWRHVYQTPRWKEYIYGLTDHKWKVYTYDVEEGPNFNPGLTDTIRCNPVYACFSKDCWQRTISGHGMFEATKPQTGSVAAFPVSLQEHKGTVRGL